MDTLVTSSPASDPVLTSPSSRRRSPFWLGFWIVLGLVMVGLLVGWWWVNRGISPTVLEGRELHIAEQKWAALQGEPVEEVVEATEDEPIYVPGERTLELTEKEINGLIHAHTSLGEQLKIELATGAIHARLVTTLPEDFPVIGGKELKGRARVRVRDEGGQPALILEDLTLWGISVPNAWLGQLKGQNLLSAVELEADSLSPAASGIEEFQVERGKLRLRLAE